MLPLYVGNLDLAISRISTKKMKAIFTVLTVILALAVSERAFAQGLLSSDSPAAGFADTTPRSNAGWTSSGRLSGGFDSARIQPVDVREASRANAMSAAYEAVCSLILDTFYKLRREAVDGQSFLSSLPLSIQADAMGGDIGLQAWLTDKWAVSVTNTRSFDIQYSLPATRGKISLATDNFKTAMISFSLGL